MVLYLVRHAEAEEGEVDDERPLSEHGWAEARKVSGYAAQHLAIEVDRVLHSRKTRARQTAQVLADALEFTPTLEEVDALDPEADPHEWAERLADGHKDVLLVGHVPHVERLAALLLCGDDDRPVVTFQTGSILCLERREGGAWSVRWMVVPNIT